MGKRGPTPTPLSLLKQRGSQLVPGREKGTRESVGSVEESGVLSINQRIIFDLTKRRLEKCRGLVGEIDGPALERYSVLVDLWQKALDYVNENGDTVMNKYGEMKASPKAANLLKYGEQLARLEAKFGMTPSDRIGLEVPEESIDDAKERKFMGA